VCSAVTESLSHRDTFFVKVVCTVAEFLLKKKVAPGVVFCVEVDDAFD
jgi:hypothetical protein